MSKINDRREKLVDDIIADKGPWSSVEDRNKAKHACQIVFNTIYSSLRPKEYKRHLKQQGITFKKVKPRIEQ